MLKHHLFLTYCIVSVLATLWCAGTMAREDLHRYRNPERYRNYKFDYNYKSPASYFMVIACLPGINLLALALLLGGGFARCFRGKKN